MPQSRSTKATRSGIFDDSDLSLQDRLADPDFRATYEDEAARHELVQYFSKLRREKGWSQAEMARRLGTTQSAISDFEKGLVEPRLATLQRWARVFGERMDFQLWNGPKVRFSSWIHRTLQYEEFERAVELNDEIARAWYSRTEIGIVDHAPRKVEQARVNVHTIGRVDVRYQDLADGTGSDESESLFEDSDTSQSENYARRLRKELSAAA